MEIAQILTFVLVLLDGQEIIVNLQFVMESPPLILPFVFREEIVLNQITAHAIHSMTDPIVNTPIAMVFQINLHLFVQLMETVFLQTIAIVL
jgi:hypothetical protein